MLELSSYVNFLSFSFRSALEEHLERLDGFFVRSAESVSELKSHLGVLISKLNNADT